MKSAKSLCKKLLNFKNTVITGCEFYTDADSVNHIRIQARPSKWHENECPYCHRRCPGYDSRCRKPRIWRGLDWGTTLVEIEYQTHRIECLEHGVVVADIPWAYPGSGFTKDFDLTAAWFAVHLPRSVVAEYFRVDWETVGRCISRTKDVIEPEISHRLDNLVNIGIDETSYEICA